MSRREDWLESVERYGNFFLPRIPQKKQNEYRSVIKAFGNLEMVGAMRALWSAGPALERDNICGYNCAYMVIDNIKKFAELLHILMCGAGVGISVERQHIAKLPEVPDDLKEVEDEIIFADSRLGWSEGVYTFLKRLTRGEIWKCNFDKIRPKGSVLKTMGGRASGPEPLIQLIEFITRTAKNAQGRKLNSEEVYDICCYIAQVVVVGGVRRSAMISLSNFSDRRMADAKIGDFHSTNPQRRMSNNSVAYTEKPGCKAFMEEWLRLTQSGTGERGIFNREGAKFIVRKIGRRDDRYEFGCNPCSEILLRPDEFCNLSEDIVRTDDTLDVQRKKVRQATIAGVVQSTLTDFKFLGRQWKKNCEEERLLGVSLTGLRDHPILGRVSTKSRSWLREMKAEAIETAREWSEIMEIPMPAAITCVKPSGNTSQLADCASGLHPRYSPFYIRRVRMSRADSLAQCLIDQGIEASPEQGENWDNCSTVVFSFPIKSPKKAVFRDEVDALEQLEYWKMLQEEWCEHKPSCTIYVKDDEWLRVGSWCYDNWDYISGISFLPYDGGVYQLAPYQEITEEEYDVLMDSFPKINFDKLAEYESTDLTEGAKELACAGGACEI